ncbi:hypothetical protein C8Q76DRAFT_418104 [Earliella scabrosa]|nr:hypothetical protein C8Q76DRAFT_418104 [Earliella scabrosa]
MQVSISLHLNVVSSAVTAGAAYSGQCSSGSKLTSYNNAMGTTRPSPQNGGPWQSSWGLVGAPPWIHRWQLSPEPQR